MSNTTCPLSARIAKMATPQIFDCMKVFEAKGSKNLSDDEFSVETAMLSELWDRGFEKWATAYVERS